MDNATSLLLQAVLADKPCADISLESAVATAPFALHCIIQQCVFTVRAVSVTMALLTDGESDVGAALRSGHGFQSHPRDNRLCCDMNPDSAQRDNVGRSILRSTLACDSHVGRQIGVQLPHVVPASSLAMHVTIIGGGTAARCLLSGLLDEHPTLVHPTRICVIARQTENLHSFASRGVRCVTRKNCRQALAGCDVLVLACQPDHLHSISQEYRSDTDEANANADGACRTSVGLLKSTAIVFSCVSALPRAKIAVELNHSEQLIIRAEIMTPSHLPNVAAGHAVTVAECMRQQVQQMANHDSFLKEAVIQAEDAAIQHMADSMLRQPQANESGSKVPTVIAHRAAMMTAMSAVAASQVSPAVSDVVLEEGKPRLSFFSFLWVALQSYSSVVTGTSLVESAVAFKSPVRSRTQRDSSPARFCSRSGNSTVGASSSSGFVAETPFWCAAFALLPRLQHGELMAALWSSRHVRLTAPTSLSSNGVMPDASDRQASASSVCSFFEASRVFPAPTVTATITKHLPNLYSPGQDDRIETAMQHHFVECIKGSDSSDTLC